jgi:hypothetical protein
MATAHFHARKLSELLLHERDGSFGVATEVCDFPLFSCVSLHGLLSGTVRFWPSGLQPNASKKLVSDPIKSVASTHAFGGSHPGSDRYFDLRLAPDYAE